MFEINLVPNVKLELLKTQKIRNLVIFYSVIIGAAVIAAVIIMALILGGQKIASNVLSNTIKKDFSALSSRPGINETVTLQNQMKQIGVLSGSKQVPSRLFAFLDVSLPKNDSPYFVTLSSFNYNKTTGVVTMDGQSRGGYPALDALIKTIGLAGYRYVPDYDETKDAELKEEDLEKQGRYTPAKDEDPIFLLDSAIAINETSYGRDADGGLVLRFSINFTLNTELFDFSKKHLTIVGPSKQIVTDSYVQVRDNIFEAEAEDCLPDDKECLEGVK
ncbi:MAG: hypothetical protein LBM97_01670 [Candidatus Nomurabacteria bacterium]|jgi:hypothetical protein|nr:hypothetical protein [Candidatus Nomurabacteria bacterium]